MAASLIGELVISLGVGIKFNPFSSKLFSAAPKLCLERLITVLPNWEAGSRLTSAVVSLNAQKSDQ